MKNFIKRSSQVTLILSVAIIAYNYVSDEYDKHEHKIYAAKKGIANVNETGIVIKGHDKNGLEVNAAKKDLTTVDETGVATEEHDKGRHGVEETKKGLTTVKETGVATEEHDKGRHDVEETKKGLTTVNETGVVLQDTIPVEQVIILRPPVNVNELFKVEKSGGDKS